MRSSRRSNSAGALHWSGTLQLKRYFAPVKDLWLQVGKHCGCGSNTIRMFTLRRCTGAYRAMRMVHSRVFWAQAITSNLALPGTGNVCFNVTNAAPVRPTGAMLYNSDADSPENSVRSGVANKPVAGCTSARLRREKGSQAAAEQQAEHLKMRRQLGAHLPGASRGISFTQLLRPSSSCSIYGGACSLTAAAKCR